MRSRFTTKIAYQMSLLYVYILSALVVRFVLQHTIEEQ